MFTGLVIGGILLFVALVVLSHWCFYRAGRADGYEQGLADRKAERQAPRHARTEPRRRPESTTLVQDDPPEPEGWYEPPPGLIRSHTSAADIYPVILPEPGRYQPQPVRSTAPDTGTMPRVELVDASTGEMRAVTDKFIAEHCS